MPDEGRWGGYVSNFHAGDAVKTIREVEIAVFIVDGLQPDAMQLALDKGEYFMGCPQAAEELVTRRMANPRPAGGWMSGLQRAEYTVAVSGCEQRIIFIVICPFPGQNCLATLPGTFNTWQEQ